MTPANERALQSVVVALSVATSLELARAMAPILESILESERTISTPATPVSSSAKRSRKWREKRNGEACRDTPTDTPATRSEQRSRHVRDTATDTLDVSRGGEGGESDLAVSPSLSLPHSFHQGGSVPENARDERNGEACRDTPTDTPATRSERRVADPFGDDWLGNVWRASFLAGFGNKVTAPSRGELRKLLDAIETHGEGADLVARETWLKSAIARWSSTAPTKRTLFGFVDWLDGGARVDGTGDHFRDKKIAAEVAEEKRRAEMKKIRADVDAEAMRATAEADAATRKAVGR